MELSASTQIGIKLKGSTELSAIYNKDHSPKFYESFTPSSLGHKMALVNLAAFMGQAMRKTIIYDACNESNWDKWHSADMPKAPNIPAEYLLLL